MDTDSWRMPCSYILYIYTYYSHSFVTMNSKELAMETLNLKYSIQMTVLRSVVQSISMRTLEIHGTDEALFVCLKQAFFTHVSTIKRGISLWNAIWRQKWIKSLMLTTTVSNSVDKSSRDFFLKNFTEKRNILTYWTQKCGLKIFSLLFWKGMLLEFWRHLKLG